MTLGLGVRLALGGLSTRAPWVATGIGFVALLVLALLERVREPAYAADRALLGPAFGVVVPLVAYALFEGVYGGMRSGALLSPFGRHGADRRELSLGVHLTLAAACSGVAAAFGAVTVFAARGAHDGALLRDALASLWGGALAGAAYAGLLAVASRYGRRGRLVGLVLDWIVGASTGALAIPWPRSHARNLLGGDPVLDMTQFSSALALAAIAAAGILVGAARETR